EFFLERINLYLLPYYKIYAYCLMPNHFHLLAKVEAFNIDLQQSLKKENTKAAERFLEEGSTYINRFLEDQMRRLFSSHALKAKTKYNTRGALFQEKFKRIKILNDTSILNKIVYIHHNPIHHGFTAVYEDWRYSSFNAYLSQKKTKIARKYVFNWLGDGDLNTGKEIFLDFHKDYKLNQGENWQIDFDEW
ncbi:MAG: hypothetical protein AAFO82_23830, partial [Bacteroidota bacterium]